MLPMEANIRNGQSAKNKPVILLVALVSVSSLGGQRRKYGFDEPACNISYATSAFPWIDFAGWETRRGWFALASKGSLKGECRFQASP